MSMSGIKMFDCLGDCASADFDLVNGCVAMDRANKQASSGAGGGGAQQGQRQQQQQSDDDYSDGEGSSEDGSHRSYSDVSTAVLLQQSYLIERRLLM